MTAGQHMNQRNDMIVNAWINLWICITTKDMHEFYKALGGNTPRAHGHHYTWDEANKPWPVKK